MLEIDGVAERLTAARDDRYAEVVEGVAAHAAAHGCGMEVPSAAETRTLSVLVRATRATYVLEIGGGKCKPAGTTSKKLEATSTFFD